MSSDRAHWLRQCRAVFEADFGAQSGSVTITLRNASGQEVSYTLPSAVPNGPSPCLSPTEAEICRVVGTGKLTGKAIANRLGRAYDGTLKTLLRNLVERGVIVNREGGYQLNSVPVNE